MSVNPVVLLALGKGRDARPSFTTAIGYRPHGVDVPAWKAVFFNPKTDEAIIDCLVESIDEVA